MPGTPAAFARVTAALMPRALNEPVGFCASSLMNSLRTPTAAASDVDSMSGVSPSPSDTGASPANSGMNGA